MEHTFFEMRKRRGAYKEDAHAHTERDRNNILRNPLTATCDDGTTAAASELEKGEKMK